MDRSLTHAPAGAPLDGPRLRSGWLAWLVGAAVLAVVVVVAIRSGETRAFASEPSCKSLADAATCTG